MKVFTIFAVLGCLIVTTEIILGRFGINNLFLINIYWLMQVECFVYIYIKRIQKRSYSDILQVIGMLYLLLWMYDFSFDSFPDRFNEFFMASGNIFLIIITVLMFYEIFPVGDKKMSEYSIFWIGIGVIIYSASTVIVFTMSNKLLEIGIQYFNMLWHINWGFTIISNVLFARSFTCKTF